MRQKYKSIFISDFHLGFKGCKADQLCSFLKNNTSENLFLVGDIFDGWRLKNKWYLPQSHANVIRRILTASKRGTKVKYIVGNHDEFLRDWFDLISNFGNIEIVNQIDYTAINGDKLLVIHGDMFDTLMLASSGKFLMHVGDKLYDVLITLNNILSKIRNWFHLPYWSLSKWIKKNTKQVVGHLTKFENILTDYVFKKGYNGIICGHVHTSMIKDINRIKYYNCGDWVENCSALVECWDGTFELLFFNQ